MTQTRQRTLQTLILLAGLLVFSQKAISQPFFVPTEGLKHVSIQNLSNETQYIWIDVPVDVPKSFDEVYLVLEPKQTIQYSFQKELNYPWVQLKSYDEVSVKVTAYSDFGKTQVVEGRSEALISSVFSTKSQGTLILANLSPIAQEGIILGSSPRGRKAPLTLNLPKFGVAKVALSVERGDKIRIQGKYPLTALFLSNTGSPTALRPDRTITEFSTKPQGSYFEMINVDKDESFIFYSEDPKVIQEARFQILNPPLRKSLVASIQKGHDHTNRNLSSLTKTPWSWSVSEIFGFSNALGLDCDGTPSIVEDYLVPWLTSQQNICFWGYRIQRELNPEEVRTGFSPQY